MKKKKKRERAGKVPGTKCKYKKEVKNRKLKKRVPESVCQKYSVWKKKN